MFNTKKLTQKNYLKRWIRGYGLSHLPGCPNCCTHQRWLYKAWESGISFINDILNRAHGSASWSQGRGADGTWNHHICYTWSNVMDDYLHCLERGQATSAKMSAFLRRNLQWQGPNDSSKAG
uniref:Uncharacterized protein n=1 Tax=Vitis vinifera TaxID=29760 RepID=F6GTI6_VITVI